MFLILCLVLFSSAFGSIVPGGETPVGVWDPTFLKAVSMVAGNYSQRFHEQFVIGENFKIMNATRQIVNGVLYRIHVDLEMKGHKYPCDVTVYDVPWSKVLAIVSDSCCCGMKQSSQTKRGDTVPGGNFPTTISKGVRDAAAFAMDNMNQASKSNYYDCLAEIRNPTEQVVAGTIYKMDVVIQPSTIRKTPTSHVTVATGCTINAAASKSICEVQVEYQPWKTTQYHMIGFRCDPIILLRLAAAQRKTKRSDSVVWIPLSALGS